MSNIKVLYVAIAAIVLKFFSNSIENVPKAPLLHQFSCGIACIDDSYHNQSFIKIKNIGCLNLSSIKTIDI